jgi:hypothetical protein
MTNRLYNALIRTAQRLALSANSRRSRGNTDIDAMTLPAKKNCMQIQPSSENFFRDMYPPRSGSRRPMALAEVQMLTVTTSMSSSKTQGMFLMEAMERREHTRKQNQIKSNDCIACSQLSAAVAFPMTGDSAAGRPYCQRLVHFVG